MRCELLSRARKLVKDPNLECGETCRTDYRCNLAGDSIIFPKTPIKEGPHNENIVDGSKMGSGEIYNYLKVDTGKNLGIEMLWQEIEEIGKR